MFNSFYVSISMLKKTFSGIDYLKNTFRNIDEKIELNHEQFILPMNLIDFQTFEQL